MRLHRLEIEGFGPFRERQVVDFDAFADDGIFLIAGRTGAGKSSILDAVCFGLYGGVPRYEGGDKRLRSDHCEPDDVSRVCVEFSTAAGRFRVTRSPEYLRPAKRGGGMTKQAASALLEELTEQGWEGRAARAVDVADELDAILQLNQQQFLQVILLAQNRFARFLLADSKDRQTLLRRLFGTERFRDVQERFEERRRASELTVQATLATVAARTEEAEGVVTAADLWGSDGHADESVPDTGQATTEDRITGLRRALVRAEYRAERRAADRDEARQRLDEADAALAELTDRIRIQRERDRARVALRTLDAEAASIADLRRTLERARAAEGLRSALAAVSRAESELTAAREAERIARETWTGLGSRGDAEERHDLGAEEIGSSSELLESWAADQLRISGEWRQAAQLEAHAAERAEEDAEARRAVESAEQSLAAKDAERAALPELISAADQRLAMARQAADRLGEAERMRDEAAARRTAAADVERVDADLAQAEQRVVAASAELDAVQLSLTALRRRRLDGFAGELAASLRAGEACPVCGAVEHPAPAVHSDPVSAEDIATAESAREDALRREREATSRAAELRADRAAALARSGARSLSEASDDLTAAQTRYEAVSAAAVGLPTTEAELEELRGREQRIQREREDAARAVAAARENLAALERRSQDADAQIAAARGAFASVAARLEYADSRIRAARSLADAMDDLARRADAATAARAEQTEALALTGFGDAAAAEAALLPALDQQRLESAITAHTVEREKERQILLPLELLALPEEPIDPGPAEEAATAARAAWMTAVDDALSAAATAERLAQLIEAAAAEHARAADRVAQHEVLHGLADTIAGRGANTRRMALETFVLAAELEEIVAAANRRLEDMSAGRYQLQHSDALAARGAASGLGIVVFDAFTGQTRPAQSLSGGEMFLGSLALALGLAEVVTARAGGIRLDTLFIDEGFGSLDADTLDVAMRTLDELRAGGRTVGVISHVESMQEQIPAQLTVERTESGPSRIRA